MDDISTNGVFVNGQRLGKGCSRILRDGDVLSLVVAPRQKDGKWYHPDKSINDVLVAYRISIPSTWTCPVDHDETPSGTHGLPNPVAENLSSSREDDSAAANSSSAAEAQPEALDTMHDAKEICSDGREAGEDTPTTSVSTGQVSSSRGAVDVDDDHVIIIDDAPESKSSHDQKVHHDSRAVSSERHAPPTERKGGRVKLVEQDLIALFFQQREKAGNKSTFEDDFTLGEILGEGGFAKVHSGIHKESNIPVAVKVIDKVRWRMYNQGGSLRESQMQEEFEVHSKLAHPNIVRYVSGDLVQSEEKRKRHN